MSVPTSKYRSYGWLRLETDINWRYRLTVTMPMMLLGIIDNVFGLLTLGFVQPGLSLSWGFRRSMQMSRKAKEKARGCQCCEEGEEI